MFSLVPCDVPLFYPMAYWCMCFDTHASRKLKACTAAFRIYIYIYNTFICMYIYIAFLFSLYGFSIRQCIQDVLHLQPTANTGRVSLCRVQCAVRQVGAATKDPQSHLESAPVYSSQTAGQRLCGIQQRLPSSIAAVTTDSSRRSGHDGSRTSYNSSSSIERSNREQAGKVHQAALQSSRSTFFYFCFFSPNIYRYIYMFPSKYVYIRYTHTHTHIFHTFFCITAISVLIVLLCYMGCVLSLCNNDIVQCAICKTDNTSMSVVDESLRCAGSQMMSCNLKTTNQKMAANCRRTTNDILSLSLSLKRHSNVYSVLFFQRKMNKIELYVQF